MAQVSADKKKKAVIAYGKGVSVDELAVKYGVSTRTIYRWVAAKGA